MPLLVQTVPDHSELHVGEDLTVRCAAQRGGQALPQAALVVDIEPMAPRQSANSLRTVFRPQTAGLYTVRCRLAADDGAGSGTVIQVLPRAADSPEAPRWAATGGSSRSRSLTRPVRVKPEVNAVQAAAGDWVDVRCIGYAVSGKRLGEVFTTFSVTPVLEPAALPAALVTRQGFSATRSNLYEVQCQGLEGAGDDDIARVLVVPGLPHHWSHSDYPAWNRSLPCAAQHLPLSVSASVHDIFENLVQVPLELSAEPADEVVVHARDVQFKSPGNYVVTASVAGNKHPDNTLAPLVQDVYVDSTPPHVTIESPARGAMVQSDDETVMVRGTVYDVSGLQSVVINGNALPLRPGQQQVAFEVAQHAGWGLSRIQIDARDACELETQHVQSFLHSAFFDDNTGANMRHQALLQFNDPALLGADAATGAQGPHVAGLIEAALNTGKLSETLSNTLYAYPADDSGFLLQRTYWPRKKPHPVSGFEIVRSKPLSYSPPSITALEVQDSTLHLHVVLHDLKVPVQVIGHTDFGALGHSQNYVDAEVFADTLEIDLKVYNADGPEETKADASVSFGAEGPHLKADWGLLRKLGLGRLLNQLSDRSFVVVARKFLGKELERQLAQSVRRGLKSTFETVQNEQTLRLPPPLAGGLRAAQGIENVQFLGSGAEGRVAMSIMARLMPSELNLGTAESMRSMDIKLAEPWLGPIRHPEQLLAIEPPPADEHPAISAAVGDDVINELFWAVWAGGAFDLPDFLDTFRLASARIPAMFPGSHMSLFALMPPVVHPTEEPDQWKVSWGDIVVDGEINLNSTPRSSDPPLRIRAFVTADLLAKLEVDNGVLKLSAAQAPELHMQADIMADRPGMAKVCAETLEVWVSEAMWDSLNKVVGRFELPGFAVGQLPGIHNDTVWQMVPTRVSRQPYGNQITLHGNLRSLGGKTR